MRASLSCLLLVVACGTSSESPPDPPNPDAQAVIPTATGTCPTIAAGDVTFAPAGMPPRTVNLALDPAATTIGPLVLYWHATGSAPAESSYSLGETQDAIIAAGGVIAAPSADPTAGTFEWFIVNGNSKLDDFLLADEIVACLAAAGRIDPAYVHSMGMSAGALQTSALSFVRSSYIASVATFSGGIPDGFTPSIEDPENKFAAMIFDGGTTDTVFGVDFKVASENYQQMLDATGHFTTRCDHGLGHDIPLDAAPSIATFFAANGFGAWPSPYESGIPASFPAYCAR